MPRSVYVPKTVTPDELYHFPAYNPEKHSTQHRFISEYASIFKYFADADHKTLDFYEIDSKKHNDLLERSLVITADKEIYLMAVHTPKRNKTVNIDYYDGLEAIDPLCSTKMIAHETGHLFQANSKNIYSRLGNNLPLRFISRLSSSFPVLTTTIGSTMLHSLGVPIIFAPAIVVAGMGAITHISRVNELDADCFADKLIPEISYDEMILDCVHSIKVRSPLDRKSMFMLNSKIMSAAKQPFLRQHPSDEIRTIISNNSCDKYWQYKSDNNIPSLIQR